MSSDNWPGGMLAALIIPWHAAKKLKTCFFGKQLKELRVALKVATRYEYDNSHDRFEYMGLEFPFSFHEVTWGIGSELERTYRSKLGRDCHGGPNGSNVRTLNIWSMNQQKIHEETFLCEWAGPLPEGAISAAEAAMLRFYNKEIACSDCGDVIPLPGAGRYFAGVYCSGCWEGTKGCYRGKGGWKKTESEETYD